MEIKIIEDKKSRVVFELVGADHTIANILKEKISQQKGVTTCTYNIEHPMVSSPKFFIEAESAKKAIETAVDELKKENNDLKKQIK